MLIWNSLPTSNYEAADVVVGQSNFTSSGSGLNASTLHDPRGVAAQNNRLFVADSSNRRVLVWDPIPTTNGVAATWVLGQGSFTTNMMCYPFGGAQVNATGFGGAIWGLTTFGSGVMVADGWADRILWWTSAPTANGQAANKVFGQPDFTTCSETPGQSVLSEACNVSCYGATYVCDQNRVLIWDGGPANNGQAAARVLGQPDWTSLSANNPSLSGRTLSYPKSASGDSGHTVVADSNNNRVLIWNNYLPSSYSNASVVLGQPDMTSNSGSNPGVSATIASPLRVASDGTRLFVADGTNNRVLIWDSLPITSNQPATRVLGQANFTTRTEDGASVSAQTLDNPDGIATAGGQLFVSDTDNHRVLIWTSLPTTNRQTAELVLGQPSELSATANNGGISASGMNNPRGLAAAGGKLVVADGSNNRVLLWNSIPVSSTVPADLVLGQPDVLTNTVNNGGVSASSLYAPMAAATDGTKLAVADYLNNRVLLWNSFPTSNGQPADVVLGQPNPISNTANNGGLSASSLYRPYRVTWDGRRLYVADRSNNRVLVWNGWPTSNGAPAHSIVDPTGSTYPSPTSLQSPRDVAVTGELLWIVDETPRVVKLQVGYFEAVLAYDQPDRLYCAEPFAVTATFTRVPASAPTLLIAGGGVGAANDVTATAMLPTADPLEFTFTRSVETGDDGAFSLTLTASSTLGETLIWQPWNNTFSVDTVAPAVTLTYSQADRLYKAESYTLNAAFSETLAATPTVALAGAVPDGVNDVTPTSMTATADPKVWTFTRTALAGDDDTFAVTLGASDPAGNTAPAAPANNTFTIDATAPMATVSWNQPDRKYKVETLVLTATFAEPITPTAPRLSISGTTGGGAVTNVSMTAGADPTVWTYTKALLAGDTQGTHSITLTATDAAGNALTVQPTDRTFVEDSVVPTVTLAYNQADRFYGAEPFGLTATFSEAMGVTPVVAIVGASPGGMNDVAPADLVATASPTVWTYSRTAVEGDDDVFTITLTAADPSRNAVAVQPANRTFTVDATVPTASLAYSKSPAVYKAESFKVTATFSENITPSAPTITISGTTGGIAVTNVSMTQGATRSIWTYARTLQAGDTQGAHTITLTAADGAGNGLPAQPANKSFVVDTAAPTASFTFSKPSRQYKAEEFAVSVVFNEAMAATPTLAISGTTGGISVTNAAMAATADPAVWTYSATLVPADTQGTHSLTLTASDLAGNALAVHPVTRTFTAETVPPTATFTYNQADRLYKTAEPIRVTATFSEDITPTAPALSIDGTVGGATVAGAPMAQGATLKTWTWQSTVAANDTEGTRTITLAAADGAGNGLAAQAANNTFSLYTRVLAPTDVTVTAPNRALRPEPGQALPDPTPVTVTVINSSTTNNVRVDAVALTFFRGTQSAAGHYVVTAPAVPVTLSPQASAALVYQVRPTAATPVFEPVDLTATVSATDLGTSQGGEGSAGTRWSVVPRPGRVLGQADLTSTYRLRRGLESPTAAWTNGAKVAVADYSNNRVLIWSSFPASNGQPPDLVLGQPGFGSTDANHGGLSASSLDTPLGLHSDGTRLLVSDMANNRVLVWTAFPTSNLQPADLVLGQSDFLTNLAATARNRFNSPEGVFTDGTKVLVADPLNSRVLLWNTFPTANGQNASTVLGQTNFTSSVPGTSATQLRRPSGVWTDGTRLLVSDYLDNRVLYHSTWPTGNGQAATWVLGQPDMGSNLPGTTQSTLNRPESVTASSSRIYVGDRENHRVMRWSFPTGNGSNATAVLGQADFTSAAGCGSPLSGACLSGPIGISTDGSRLLVPDWTDNRVLMWNSLPGSGNPPADLVLGQPDFTTDAAGHPGTPSAATLSSPGGLFTTGGPMVLADRYNHRVLIWDSAPLTPSQPANRVLGQADFTANLANRGGSPNSSRLNMPAGCVLVGLRLAVADQSNHRILIWNTFPPANGQVADLVLGQTTFSGATANAGGVSAASLNNPKGLATDGTRLIAADYSNHRVLIWDSLPITHTQPANLVLGQTDFSTNAANSPTIGASTLFSPSSVWTDGTRLVVTEYGNHRALVWNVFPTANGQPADLVLGQPNFTSNTQNNGDRGASTLYHPYGVTSVGSRLLVGDYGNNRVLVWASFPTANFAPATAVLGQAWFANGSAPVEVTPDSLGYPIGLAALGNTLWLGDSTQSRVLGYDLEHFQATLAFDKPGQVYRAETLALTATFTSDAASAPTLAIAGGGPSAANDVSATAMAPTADPRVWTYSQTLSADDVGTFTVTLSATSAAGESLGGQPGNNTFTVDVAGPTATLAFSQADRLYRAEVFAVTATFGEALGTTPTIALTGSSAGGANDVTATPMTPTADPRVWTFTRTVVTGDDDTFTVTLAASDAAGNGLDTQPANNTFTVEATAPTAVLAYSKASRAYHDEAFVVTATFSKPITPTAPAVTIDGTTGGGAVSNVPMTMGADRTVWTYSTTLQAGDTQGTHALTLTASDAAGNALAVQPAGNAFTVDTAQPTATIAYSKPGRLYGVELFRVTATFSEPITPVAPTVGVDGTTGGGTVTNAPMTMGADASVWTWQATLQSGDTQGTHTLLFTANDAAGNELAYQPTGNTFTVDTAVPTATLSYSKANRVYGVEAFVVTATFSEPITPAAPTLSVDGTTGGGTVSNVAMTMGADAAVWIYSTVLDSGDTGGVHTLTIAAADAAGNALAVQPAQNTFTFDTAMPMATLTFNKVGQPYQAEPFVVTATFSEAMAPTPTVAIAGATPGGANDVGATAMAPTADPRVWTFARTLVDGDNDSFTVTLTGVDLAGNSLLAQPAGNTFTVDTSVFTATLTYSKSNLLFGAGPFAVTATFSEALLSTPTFATAGDTPGGPNDVTATAMTATAEPRVWTFARTVVGGDDDAFTVTLAGTSATSRPLAGQPVNNKFVVEATAPAVTLAYDQADRLYLAESFRLTATFTEELNGTPTVAIAGAVPGGANDVAAVGMTASGDPKVWTFARSVCTGDDDTFTVTFVASDEAGNAVAAQPANNTFVVDTTTPTATLTFNKVGQPYQAETFLVTATFAEAVQATPTVAIAGTTPGGANDVAATAMTATADAKVWTYARTVVDGDDDTFTVTLTGADPAGNSLAAQPSNNTFTVDASAPTATLAYDQADRLYAAGPFAVTATFSEALAATPTIALAGATVGGANDVAATAMTPTADAKVWTFARTVVFGDDDTFTVTLAGADATGNAQVAQPLNSTFTVDASAPAAWLAYSRAGRLYADGAFAVTATFTEVLAAAPTIGLAGATAGGANDVVATAMTPTADAKVWTYARTVLAGDDDTFTVTLAASDPAGNALAGQPLSNTFTVDTSPPAVTLAYDQADRLYRAEAFALTATFSEALGAAPRVAIAGGTPGGANDVSTAAMVATVDAKVWTFARTALGGDDDTFTVAFTAADPAGNTLTVQPANRTFRVDATPPAAPVLTFSQGPSRLKAGNLVITADFAEDLAASLTPSLVFTGTAATNGRLGPVAPSAARVSPTRFVYAATVSRATAPDGEGYTATVDRSTVEDLAGNVQSASSATAVGLVDPAAATLSFGSLAAPALVSLGQVFSAQVVVSNPGGTSIDVTSTSLTFDGTGLTAVPDQTPSVIAGGTSATFRYTVTVSLQTGTGPHTATLSVLARDHYSNADAGNSQTLAPAVTVQTPATLQVLSVESTRTVIARGQNGFVTLSVRNTGQATATLSSIAPTFHAGDSDVTSEYTAAPGSNPALLDGGATGTFTFAVGVGAGATLGTVSLNGTVSGADANSGAVVSDASADVTDSWTVVAAGAAFVETVMPSPVLNDAPAALTVTGFGFTGLTGLRLGEPYRISLTDVRVLSDDTLTATLPAGVPAGTYALIAARLSSESPAGGPGLTVVPGVPRVMGSTVTTCVEDVPAPLTLTGSGFAGATGVNLTDLANTALAGLRVVDDGTLEVTVPAGVVPGTYRFVVATPRGTSTVSIPTLVVRSAHVAPVANAGNGFSRAVGELIRLDGTASSPSGGYTTQLVYGWSFTSVPVGSSVTTASFSENGSIRAARPSFVPDRKGPYAVRLIVDDGVMVSPPALVTVTIVNSPPRVTAAVATLETTVGQSVRAAASVTDPNLEDRTDCLWSVVSVPPGSAVTGSSLQPFRTGTVESATFTPDLPGTYRLRLVASDGEAVSLPVDFTVHAIQATGAIVFLSPADGDKLSDDASAARDFQLAVRVRVASTAGGPVRLLVDNLPVAVATVGADLVVEFPTVTLPIGRTSWLTAQQQTNAASIRVTVPTALVPHATVHTPGAAGGGPRVLMLDASGSFSPTGQQLTYLWELVTAPTGASSFSSTEPTTQYVATVAGTYGFTVTITDVGGNVTRTMTFTVDTVPPVADARGDRQLMLSRPDLVAPFPTTLELVLDGTASSDPNGQPLTYFWEVLQAPDRPAGQAATTSLVRFSSFVEPRPRVTFSGARVPEVTGAPLAAAGVYVFRLTVSKGPVSASDTVQVVAVDPGNLLPAADAGVDRMFALRRDTQGNLVATFPDPLVPAAQQGDPANLCTFVRLDGRESADSKQRPVTYAWTVVSKPSRSAIETLRDASTPFPCFTPDVEGLYRFQLVVNNGLYDSAPSQVGVLIAKANQPPQALPEVQDLRPPMKRCTPADPPSRWPVGSRVDLDGSSSLDPDAGDRLSYQWAQTAGPSVSLEPNTTQPHVTFTATRSGRLEFRLTVTDPHGVHDSETVCCLVCEGSMPLVSIVATAPGTAPGEAVSEGIAVTSCRSLRTTASTTVTLTGNVTGAPQRQTFDFLWRQVGGPTVQLSSTGLLGTAQPASVTQFVPTTSRVHTFEMVVLPLNATGERTGLLLKRRVRVIVDTATASVPEAVGIVTPESIPLSGSTTARTVTLDGRGSRLVGVLSRSGLPLCYSWRQVAGPRGTLDNPYAPQTHFVAPSFEGQATSRNYLFELMVDVTPPGDRSEPVYRQVVQQGQGATPIATIVRVYLDGQPISEPTTLTDGLLLLSVTLPAQLADNPVLTVEQVDDSGSRLDPPVVLRTSILVVTTNGPTVLRDDGTGVIAISPTVLGTTVTAVLTNLGTGTPSSGGTSWGGSRGGGGCALPGTGGGSAWPDGLVLLLPLALAGVTRHRRARAA
ncbi:MAG: hypothetical protein HY814_07115 [Candidatus Riflebacteria bacterium]|nr:hypothetical protein [Candidatus Riflebacteria bacterium]